MVKIQKFPQKLAKYLADNKIKHKILQHKIVYTAYDAAATTKRKLAETVKTLLVLADKGFYLVLLPADQKLDVKKLAKLISQTSGKVVKKVTIPGEKVMEKVLKVKAGAMSAFGGIHKLPVIMDKSLTKVKKAILGNFGIKKKIKLVVKKKK